MKSSRLNDLGAWPRFTLLGGPATLRALRSPGPQGGRRPRPPPLQTLHLILLLAPILLFSVVAHEIAHGYAALWQGDRTALEAGRLSWNPVRHIDPFLTILLPLAMWIGSRAMGAQAIVFGGAKPVPVDPRNYRAPRRGDIIVSLAGVATNAVIALVLAVSVVALGFVGSRVAPLTETMSILQAMGIYGIQLNAVLVAFNLLPIPPLDGSHVMKYLLPRRVAIAYVRFGHYGLVVLFVLISLGGRLLDWWLTPALVAANALYLLVHPALLEPTFQWLR